MSWRCFWGAHAWTLDLPSGRVRLKCTQCGEVSPGWRWAVTAPSAKVLRFRRRIRTTKVMRA